MQKKTYVLDTNVLLSDPSSLFSFEGNNVVLPMAVLEELDKQKSRQDEIGKNARQVSRTLDELRTNGEGTLIDGVKLHSGGFLKIMPIEASIMQHMPLELQEMKNDNLIIALMVQLKRNNVDSTLVSKDINVRVKCDSLGISCEDYLKQRVAHDMGEFYRGVEVVDVDQEIIDQLYQNKMISSENLPLKKIPCPNQIVILKGSKGSSSVITKCVLDNSQRLLEPIENIESAFGLEPRNKEQKFSLDLLYDEKIKIITLVGPSGTGKTLLALAAALDQLKGIGSPSKQRYNKLIVTRPVQPVGKDIGFLPGTLEEKMEPWIAPVRDNLNFLMGSQKKGTGRGGKGGRSTTSGRDEPYLAIMQDKGLIEIEAITFIRGRSIPNSFIVIDEAQNLTLHELKTIVTRVGDGTKIVLTGDIEQIDNVHVDAFTNGLTYAVEKFKDYDISGHVTLLKGERSQLATLASKIL